MFSCDRCGQCCRNISLSDIYSSLDRGDGVCRYFNEESSLCMIYENRPLECNIDAMYLRYFSEKISLEKYYQLNHLSCQQLKK